MAKRDSKGLMDCMMMFRSNLSKECSPEPVVQTYVNILNRCKGEIFMRCKARNSELINSSFRIYGFGPRDVRCGGDCAR